MVILPDLSVKCNVFILMNSLHITFDPIFVPNEFDISIWVKLMGKNRFYLCVKCSYSMVPSLFENAFKMPIHYRVWTTNMERWARLFSPHYPSKHLMSEVYRLLFYFVLLNFFWTYDFKYIIYYIIGIKVMEIKFRLFLNF